MFWNDIKETKRIVIRLEDKIDRLLDDMSKITACANEVYCNPIRCDGARVLDDGIEDMREIIDFALEKALAILSEKKSHKKARITKVS